MPDVFEILNKKTRLFFIAYVLILLFYIINSPDEYQSDSQYYYRLFAAAALGVRPLGWAIFASCLIILIIQTIKHFQRVKSVILFLAGFLFFLLTFGFITQHNFGQFIYSSTNGSVNFLIGANDSASGAFNAEVFRKGNIGYIPDAESKTYIEKDIIYKKAAIDWIKDNPVRWLSLFPLKFIHMFVWDDVAVSKLLLNDKINLYVFIKKILTDKNPLLIFSEYNMFFLIGFLILQILHHLIYLLILFSAIHGFILYYKNDGASEFYLFALLFIIIGIMMHLIVFGDPRFKYPFLILGLPFAALSIEKYFQKESRTIKISKSLR